MLQRILLIFYDFITFFENFMTLIYREHDLLRHKINFLFIYNLKWIYYTKIFINASLIGFKKNKTIFEEILDFSRFYYHFK